MTKKKKIIAEERKLMRRYLLWCNKTTKDELDRIDRRFTQLMVDHHILDLLAKNRDVKDKQSGEPYLRKIDDFKKYIEHKEKSAPYQKFSDTKRKTLQLNY